MKTLKIILGVLGLIGKAAYSAIRIKQIVESDAPKETKIANVQAKLESFRSSAAKSAASTEPTWDDAIVAGVTDWLDEAAEVIVAVWDKEQEEAL